MSGLRIVDWSALTSAGVGANALREHLAGLASPPGTASPGGDVSGMYAEPLPAPTGHALADFNVRDHLARKGTSTFDRATALAVVCCQDALRQSGLEPTGGQPARVGVALGTTLGSFKSTSDYSRETLIQERPYLVNPLLFPNTVMNCAAGQVAIRFGLRGVNATIAGGTLAFLNTVRYARSVLDRGYADVMLVGAVEEFTPHRAWAADLTGRTATVAAGEAAAVFVMTRPDAPAWVGDRSVGDLLAVTTGFGPGGGSETDRALTACVARALRLARVDGDQLDWVLTGETTDDDHSEYGPVMRALGRKPARILPKRLLGECDAASGAVALAVLLAGDWSAPGATRPEGTKAGATRSGGIGLITGRGPDGAVGAAIVRRGTDGRADRE